MTAILTPLAGPVSSSAPATLAGTPGLGNQIRVVLDAGWTYTSVQFYRNGVAISGANSSPYTQVAADIPALDAADITITALLTGLIYGPPAGISNSNRGAAATVVAAPVVNGTPTVGTPLSITGGTFSGAVPAATITRVIYADGVQVASGNGSSTYTPVTGNIGAVFTVVDTATNASGAVPNMSANSAACVAGKPSTGTPAHNFNGAAFNGATFN